MSGCLSAKAQQEAADGLSRKRGAEMTLIEQCGSKKTGAENLQAPRHGNIDRAYEGDGHQ